MDAPSLRASERTSEYGSTWSPKFRANGHALKGAVRLRGLDHVVTLLKHEKAVFIGETARAPSFLEAPQSKPLQPATILLSET